MSWDISTIDEIASVVTKGTTPTTYGMTFTDHGVNFVKAEALNGDSSLDRSGFTHVSDDTHDKLKRSQLREHDVLVTIAGANVGKCGLVRPEHLPANTNQAVALIRVDPEKAHPRFVYYHFKQPWMTTYCQRLGGQAAQPNVNLGNLKKFEVSLPDLQTQERIVAILSAYDDLIENNRRRIALLEQAARLLYREWFVHFRFPGHEAAKFVDGLPEGWTTETLTELAQRVDYGFTASADPEIDGPRFLRITDIAGGTINWPTVPRCAASEKEALKYLLAEGDIVVARTGATTGWARRIGKTEEAAIFASYLVRFRFDSRLDSTVAGVFMQSETYKSHIRGKLGGAAQPNASAKVLGSVLMTVPSQIVQKQFREQVLTNFQKIDCLMTLNAKLVAARDLLLPRLMDGRLPV